MYNNENQSSENRNFRNDRPRRFDRNQSSTSQAPRSMYYIALMCDAEIDAQLSTWKNEMQEKFECKIAKRSPAHITLITPFFLSDGKFKDLCEKLENFDSLVTEVHSTIDGFNHFGNRVIFADVPTNDNLNALQEQLENYLRNSGFPFIREAKKPFHAHITIATRDLKEEDFDAAWANFEGKPYSATFSNNSIHLMKMEDEMWHIDKEFILK